MEQRPGRNLGIVISIHHLKSLSSGYRFYSRESLINRSINCSICINQSIKSIHPYIHPSILASKHLTIQLLFPSISTSQLVNPEKLFHTFLVVAFRPQKKSIVISPHPIIQKMPHPINRYTLPRDKEPRIVGTV